MAEAPWRLIVAHESYPVFSTSTSPAVERAVVAKEVPSTVYLNIFNKDGITIGVNEDPTQVLDLDFCRANNITVMRRVNGGGAVYGGTGSAFLVLVLNLADGPVPDTATEAFPKILGAFAEVLEERYGIPARYRPLNDVEVDGRKLMPTSVKIENGVMTFRLLINLKGIDTEAAGKAMPMPPEKTRDKVNKTLESRFTWLEREAGREIDEAELIELSRAVVKHAFKIDRLERADLTDKERAYAQDFFGRLNTDTWLFGKSLDRHMPGGLQAGDRVGTGREKAPGGLIWATLVVNGGTVRHAVINGDWHPRPIDSVAVLEGALAGLPATPAALEEAVSAFLARADIEYAGVETAHLMTALTKALAEAGAAAA